MAASWHDHLVYLKRLLEHKWFVVLEGRKLGVPLPQLLIHDWSKFLPDEWVAGVARQRGEPGSSEALQKHYARNRHHPQYWVKAAGILPMPAAFRLEMLADWNAVGRSQPGTTAAWYYHYGCNFPFHPETRAWVEGVLDVRSET